ncbi:metallophosphoesterase [Staphylococcus caprae]|uniref:metallophosphoesterase n=1 Tax=Staphylococcus caprae TaxID=29380 RepID=UPI003B21046A
MPKRLLVASDIHGHGKSLSHLLKAAHYDDSKDQLVLIGDYVNNGPDSIGTLKLIKQLVKNGAIALVGNHELRWLERTDKRATEWHHFINQLPYYKVIDQYIFVHAGIDTSKSIRKQSRAVVTGHAPGNLNQYLPRNKVVIHGHIPNYRLGYKKDHIHIEHNIIDIDTGAGHNQYLTLLDLTSQRQYSVKVSDKDAKIQERRIKLK